MSEVTHYRTPYRTPLPRLALSIGLTLFLLPLVLFDGIAIFGGTKGANVVEVSQMFIQRSGFLITAIASTLLVVWLVGRGQADSSLGRTFFAAFFGGATVTSVWIIDATEKVSRKAQNQDIAIQAMPNWTPWLLLLINGIIVLRWWHEARGRALQW